MAEFEILWRDNDCLLQITGVRGASNGAYLNGAEGEATLVDAASGQPLGGVTWPLAIPYVNGSDGDYEAVIPFGVVTTHNQDIVAIVVIDGGPGLRLSLNQPVVAKDRLGD